MADNELAADGRDQIGEIGAMTDKRQQRTVLAKDRIPISPVHRRIVEIFALDAPRLLENLRPLGAWIDTDFSLRQVEQPVADPAGSIGRDDAPSIAARGVEELFRIGRERVRTDAFDKRR